MQVILYSYARYWHNLGIANLINTYQNMTILSAISTLTSATASVQASLNWTILARYTDNSLAFFEVNFMPKQGSEYDPCLMLKNGNIAQHPNVPKLLTLFNSLVNDFKKVEKSKTDDLLKSILRGISADTDTILQALETPKKHDPTNEATFVPYELINNYVSYVVKNYDTLNILTPLRGIKKELIIANVGRFVVAKLGGEKQFGTSAMQSKINFVKSFDPKRTVKIIS